jgi:hypothetical protein
MKSEIKEKIEEPVIMTFEEETRRSMRAMREAFADVVLENKAYGLPVIQCVRTAGWWRCRRSNSNRWPVASSK